MYFEPTAQSQHHPAGATNKTACALLALAVTAVAALPAVHTLELALAVECPFLACLLLLLIGFALQRWKHAVLDARIPGAATHRAAHNNPLFVKCNAVPAAALGVAAPADADPALHAGMTAH